MTRTQIESEYWQMRSAAVLYDAGNCTSYKEEIEGLVSEIASHMPTDEMEAALIEADDAGIWTWPPAAIAKAAQ
jgi:hypothetical protein